MCHVRTAANRHQRRPRCFTFREFPTRGYEGAQSNTLLIRVKRVCMAMRTCNSWPYTPFAKEFILFAFVTWCGQGYQFRLQALTSVEREGNNINWLCTENGSRQGQNLAVTGLCMPSSWCCRSPREKAAVLHLVCASGFKVFQSVVSLYTLWFMIYH